MVAPSRTLDNNLDVGRKIPSTSLSPRVMTEDEGSVLESITGPAVGATVLLARPALTIQRIYAHDGVGLFEVGGVAPAALAVPPLADFTILLKNADGVCEITEAASRDYSGSILDVWYKADTPDQTVGGQSDVTP